MLPNQIVCFKFKGIPELYANEKGEFFYKGKLARKIYNNGSIAVLCGRTKRGIIKLRKLAYKTTAEIDNLPF